MTPAATARKDRKDTVLTNDAAIGQARDALDAFAEQGEVGDFVGATMLGERLAELRFECLKAGYVGWSWAVSLARVSRGRVATVCETELLPGEGSLLAPEWIPWADRLQPGDIGAGDILPYIPDDERLEPGYEETGQDADEIAVVELGLGRARVLSPLGRDEAAMRWYSGDQGPESSEAKSASAQCSTCGFFTPLAGSLRQVFGVCANEWSNSDGRVVSADHGCGAHSETDLAITASDWPAASAIVNESEIEFVEHED